MREKKYMTDNSSFLPFVSFALIVGGGVFVGLIRNWNWGVLSVPTGVLLILAAVAFAAVLTLVAMGKITGEFMLIPVGLTFTGLLMHGINMLMIKGSYGLRIELLFTVVFAAMILIMIASMRGRKNLPRQKALIICAVICGAALVSCFMPFFLSGNDPDFTFMEIVETNLPLMFYFAAYLTYFIALKQPDEGQV